MRQGQQNKRMRGRNRKGPNPLTRSYESNGPDVKIRGTAHHVAEKYLSLARDAQSSGDRVAAESYLQHAEHYFRIIAAAQQQFAQPQVNGAPGQYVGNDDDDDDEPMQNDRFYSNIPPPPQFNQNNNGQPQPYRNGDQPNYNGNRDQQQPYNGNSNGNSSEGGGHRNNQQPQQQQPQGDTQPAFDDTGFGGEPPAFVAGSQPNYGGGNEQSVNNGQPASTEGGYRRRRRSGRDRPRFQDRGPDNNNPAPQAPAGDGGGGSDD